MVQIIQTLKLLFKTVSTSEQEVALKKRKSKKETQEQKGLAFQKTIIKST